MSFDSSKVTRKQFRGGFPEADYSLELNNVTVRQASTGTWQVSLDWRIRGERYDNLPVFENLSFTDDAFEVTVNKILDAGLEMPVIKTTSPKNAAELLYKALLKAVGHITSARVYEEMGSRGLQRNIRHYN